jgi:hypothetical protein
MADINTAISGPMDSTEYGNISNITVSRVSVQPENKTEISLTSGNTSDLYFSIPSKPNSFINGANSYLTFTYTLEGSTPTTAVTGAISNGSAGSFIRNLETIAGSTSLELINSYNVLYALQDDMMSLSRSNTLGSILEDKHLSDPKAGFDREIDTTASDGYTQKRRICQPLMSAAIGTLQNKYMPVGNDIGLRLRLTMESPDVALIFSGAVAQAGYKLEDITLELDYLTTDSATYKQMTLEADGVFKVSGTGVSHHQMTISGGATSSTILLPARNSSIKNFITVLRDTVKSTSQLHNSVGDRTRASISSYVYRNGGQNYPNLPVSVDSYSSSEAFVELSKCLHALHNTTSHCVFNRDDYVANDSTFHKGGFAFGIDFEESNFSAMAGLNSRDSNTFLSLEHSSPIASAGLICDTFVFFDTIFEINTMTGEIMVSK